MLEYVFFHKILAQHFVDIAQSFNLKATLIKQEMGWEVHLSEDIDDLVEVQLSDYYDDLFAQDQDMYEQNQKDSIHEYQAASIEIKLSDSSTTYARIDQKLMAKVLSALSFDEFNHLINDIVTAVENPDDRTICQRQRDSTEEE